MSKNTVFSQEIKNQAITLRKEGKSFKQIQDLLKVKIGTLKKWCMLAGVVLNKEQISAILRSEMGENV